MAVRRRWVWTGICVAAAAAISSAAIRARLRFPSVPLAKVEYVGSDACADCHDDRYDSWHRTFHRSMTQPAATSTVVGDFSGVELTYDGVTSRFTREGNRYFIDTAGPDGAPARYEISRT